ncbi:unnamed protein product [Caenorhabditis auriculariae]|uniref:Uncharacterized protein n=1 Tax=Caenorhabditis auriculariae TaxID=2777116 RepID=A0A8S1H9T1_9PELO|nr:unnamed protein product [Caenorhabditis auriculariae]
MSPLEATMANEGKGQGSLEWTPLQQRSLSPVERALFRAEKPFSSKVGLQGHPQTVGSYESDATRKRKDCTHTGTPPQAHYFSLTNAQE